MRKIALGTVVAVTSMVAAASVTKAEPVTLTASEMESVTAAALVEVYVPVNLVLGDVLVQTNLTTQVANATAVAIATCGVCVGYGPTAATIAAAINSNLSGLFQR